VDGGDIGGDFGRSMRGIAASWVSGVIWIQSDWRQLNLNRHMEAG